ncbi:hypothetical protein J2Y66_003637 [Paenarthrobacter nitroguajacolicus]|nr:hypothetical protein [Paenarthrobacter nitroguajacolicus]
MAVSYYYQLNYFSSQGSELHLTPTIDPVEIQCDAGDLSAYGLNIESVGGRLVQYETRSGILSDVHLSLAGHLDSGPSALHQTTDCALVLDLVKHPTFVTPAHVVLQAIHHRGRRRKIEVAQKISLGYRSTPLMARSLGLRVRCLDTAVGDDTHFRPLGKRLTKLPMEIVDTRRGCGCELKVARSHAGIVLDDPTDPEWARAGYYLSGEFHPCSEASDRKHRSWLNALVGTLYDGDFQLERSVLDLNFEVKPDNHRVLQWAVADSTSMPNMAGTPDRVTVRWDSEC